MFSTIILVGDFNINLFDGFSKQNEYSSLLSDLKLMLHIAEPTHVCSVTRSATLIDHVIESDLLNVSYLLKLLALVTI